MSRTPQIDPAKAPARALPPVERRIRLGRAVRTWAALTLSAVALVSALVVWHLVRRGRLIRERLGPPRVVRWPELPEKNSGRPES